MIDLDIKHFFSDGIYAKQMALPKDHYADTHEHNYSHLSILAKGKVLVECNGEMEEYSAPACIEIKAGIKHKIMALEDIVWFCIHKTDETDISKVDQVLIRSD